MSCTDCDGCGEIGIVHGDGYGKYCVSCLMGGSEPVSYESASYLAWWYDTMPDRPTRDLEHMIAVNVTGPGDDFKWIPESVYFAARERLQAYQGGQK